MHGMGCFCVSVKLGVLCCREGAREGRERGKKEATYLQCLWTEWPYKEKLQCREADEQLTMSVCSCLCVRQLVRVFVFMSVCASVFVSGCQLVFVLVCVHVFECVSVCA